MKVFVIGDNGPEQSALKAWNELRESLLEDAKSSLKNNKHDPEKSK